MQIGLIGLSYSGKSTLFQTLTEIHFDTAKKEANQAIVKVPDERLDYLTGIFNPKKKVNATIEIVDIAGIQKGDRTVSQFTTQIIGKIKTNDALIHIVRGFNDDAVPHPEGSVNMLRDIQIVDDETRAWTIKKGMTAQQAAGAIHTDFFNKFIRAEVVSYSDFTTHGSLNKCKDAGCFRLEGKEYICKDGDILNIRHG